MHAFKPVIEVIAELGDSILVKASCLPTERYLTELYNDLEYLILNAKSLQNLVKSKVKMECTREIE